MSPASTIRPRPHEAEPDPGPVASLPSRTQGDERHRGDQEGWPEISGYQILEELGRGGMGVVYLARHQALNRLVAVKMILAGEQASPHQLVRFRAEGEIVARLRHPNIVQIFEFGWHGRQPYFVLEHVEGGNLEQWLAGRPMPPHHAAELIETLARASHYAHEQGVVHRDLKPANVLLAPDRVGDGRAHKPEVTAAEPSPRLVPKITDFGLAKPLGTDWRLTQSGVAAGTPSYMAPEQVRAGTGAIGPQTDVYALGAILYELLTGRPPFLSASTAETMQQILTDEPLPPSHLQPTLPGDLVTVCLKCLEKEPRRRYADASELADDLRRWRNRADPGPTDRPLRATGPLVSAPAGAGGHGRGPVPR